MSYDDYVTHMARKYRLAISIAVIKTKPENITLKDHIESIRNKINEDGMDVDNLSISICSDDFNVDLTDVLSNDFDHNNDERDKTYKEKDNNSENDLNDKDIDTQDLCAINSYIDKINDEEINNTQDVYNINGNIDCNSLISKVCEPSHCKNYDAFDPKVHDTQMKQDVNESMKVLRVKEKTNGSEVETERERNTLNDVMEVLTDIDGDLMCLDMEITNQNSFKPTQCYEKQKFSRGDTTQCFTENDATLCESLDILSKVDNPSRKRNNDIPNQNSSHTDRQNETIQNSNLYKNNKESNRNEKTYQGTTKKTEINTNETKSKADIKKNDINLKSRGKTAEPLQNNIRQYRHTKEYKTIYQNVANIFDTYKKTCEVRDETQTVLNSTEDTCPTQYSESQANFIIIDNKYIYGDKNRKDNQNKDAIQKNRDIDRGNLQEKQPTVLNLPNNTTQIQELKVIDEKNDVNQKTHTRKVVLIDKDIFSQESQITSYIPNNNHCVINNDNVKTVITNNGDERNTKESQITKFATISNQEYSTAFSQCAQNMNDDNFGSLLIRSSVDKASTAFDRNFNKMIVANEGSTNFDKKLDIQMTNERPRNEFSTDMQATATKSCVDFDGNFNSMQVDLTTPVAFEKSRNPVENGSNNFDDSQMDIDDWTDSQIESIPFKVIEEMNKIKIYVNRRNDMSVEGSNDTGYRSNSQTKNSFKASQLSGWLDQSAHSLFNYLIECHLAATTQDITNEISMVLGLLVDKLHEEENYPSFLEELLNSVQSYLDRIYEDNCGENQLIEKDDTIQRVLLLNRSIHVIRYTIEKITCMLESLYKNISGKNSLYEIENINRIENICYIFHILEILLQKYTKVDQNLSQNSTQEKTLKKSSIMDIWKKKWNPEYKESKNEESQEKTCVISNCSEVLNKLIVGCMEGYSLISYYALKCFNTIQI